MHVLRQAIIAPIESATVETKVKHSDYEVGDLLFISNSTGTSKISAILVTSNIRIPGIVGYLYTNSMTLIIDMSRQKQIRNSVCYTYVFSVLFNRRSPVSTGVFLPHCFMPLAL